MARTQRRDAPQGGGGPSSEEPDTDTPPAQPPAPPAKAADNGGSPATGAQVKVEARGEAGAVRKALGRMAAEPAPAEGLTDGEMDEIAAQLASPRNVVVVSRIFPRRWQGVRTDKKLDKYRCPISLDDLSDAVFESYGGKRFNCDIHANTPTGEFKAPMGSFTIENPDEEEPYLPEDGGAGGGGGGGGGGGARFNYTGRDPTLVEDNDPVAVTEQLLDEQTGLAMRRLRVKEAKKALKELTDEDKPPVPAASTGNPEVDKRLAALEGENRRLHDAMERKAQEDRFENRFRSLEDLIRSNSKANQPPPPDNTLLVEVIRSGDTKFAEVMKALASAQKPVQQGPTRKEMLEELAELKKVFGSDDARVKRVEDRLFDFALDSIGTGSGEEDTVKVAIKELTPVLRTYVERKTGEATDAAGAGGKRLTEEEIKKLQHEAAQKAARELAEKWEREGVLVRVPAGGKPGAPVSQAPPAQPGARAVIQVEPANLTGKPGAPAPAPAQAASGTPVEPAAPAPQPSGVQDNLPYEEVDGMRVPPSPQSPVYDRKRAVDFVLDVIIEDIGKGCPADTYVIGDILDRLDDEILHGLLKCGSGAELEALLQPWAMPEKIAVIKREGTREDVKIWLERIVVTSKDEYRRQVAEAEKRG